MIKRGSLIMTEEEFEQKLLEEIEISKKNAIENIEKEDMIGAMWDVSKLIDYEAQIGILKDMKERDELWSN